MLDGLQNTQLAFLNTKITKPEFDMEYKASFKNKNLPDDYLDALMYDISLPNGSSVAFEEPLRGLTTDYVWDDWLL